MNDYPAWRERLATANDPAFWPIEAIDALLSGGRAQFWATDKAAIVTVSGPWPGGAVSVDALAAAGDKTELTGIIAPQIEAWARANGATHLRIPGRRGWTKAMKPYGFRHFQDIVIKELG